MKNARLIGAGAGSGKTYRLSQEVYQGICSGTFAPNKIMLTTFTRRAASELRGRVSAMLIEKGRTADVQLLGESLIGTVHGICSTLLKDYAFECGIAASQNVIEPTDAVKLFRRALSNGLTYEEQERIALMAYTIEIENWQETVQQLSELVRINQIDPSTLKFWAEKSVSSLLDGVSVNPTGREDLLREVKGYQAALSKSVADGEDTTKVTQECIKSLKAAARQLKKTMLIRWKDIQSLCSKEPSKKNPHYHEMARIRDAANANYTWPEVRSDMLEITKGIMYAVERAIGAYEAMKAEIGAVDYIDLEVMFLRALDNPDVRTSLAARLDVLMVDEFQDTSPIQMAIFLKMADVIPNVIWVGDPKQAIYGFRGTDPELMMKAMDEIRRVRPPENLDTSWRSRPELVEFVNSSFKSVFSTISQRPEDVCLKAARGNELKTPALEAWALEPEVNRETGKKIRQNVQTDMDQLASGIKNVLESKTRNVVDRDSKEVRDIQPRDIAILVRANDSAALLAETLRKFSIPCEVAIAGLMLEPEVRAVISAISLLLNCGDRFAAAELSYLHDVFVDGSKTRSTWVEGCLEKPVRGATSVLEKIRLASPEANRLSALELFDTAVELSEAMRITHARDIPAAAKCNLEHLRFEVSQFLEREVAAGRPATIRGAVAHLREREEAGEDRIRPIAANAAQILTYHSAKGLEWPLVILFELQKQYEAAPFDARIVTTEEIDIHAPLKGRGVIYWPYLYGRMGKRSDDNFAFLKMVHEKSEYGIMARKRQEEEKRLLYVAMTRARDYLVFAGRPERLDALSVLMDAHGNGRVTVPQSGGSESGEVVDDWLITVPTRSSSPLAIDRAQDLRWFAYRPRPKNVSPGRLTPSKVASQPGVGVTSSSSAATARVGELQSYGQRIPIIGSPDFDMVGNALHAYLAIDTSGMTDEMRLTIATQVLSSYPLIGAISPSDVVAQASKFEATVAGAWPGSKLLREVPLYRSADGVIVQGYADLLLETSDGYVIIDHKSFPGSMSALAERAALYAPQLDLYSELVAAATRRKVIGTFINYFTVGGMISVETAANKPAPRAA